MDLCLILTVRQKMATPKICCESKVVGVFAILEQLATSLHRDVTLNRLSRAVYLMGVLGWFFVNSNWQGIALPVKPKVQTRQCVPLQVKIARVQSTELLNNRLHDTTYEVAQVHTQRWCAE